MGVTVAAGSDAPVAMPDPLLDLYAATTPRSANGRAWGEEHRLEVASALRLHRQSAADLPPGRLREVRVLAVVLGGRVVAQPSVQGSR